MIKKYIAIAMLALGGLGTPPPALANPYQAFTPKGGLDKTTTIPGVYADGSSGTLSQIGQMADGSVQQTDIGKSVAPLDKSGNMPAPVSGDVGKSVISNTITRYQTTGVGICPASWYVGDADRTGAGYIVGERIRIQDGSIVQITGVKTTSKGTGAIDTIALVNGAYNSTDYTSNAGWSNWSMRMDRPWMNSYWSPGMADACFIITSTAPVQMSNTANLTAVSLPHDTGTTPRSTGIKFDGSDQDKILIQKYVDTYAPSGLLVDGTWPDNFTLDKTKNNNQLIVNGLLPGQNMDAHLSDGDIYLGRQNGAITISEANLTAGYSGNSIVKLHRVLNTPNQTAYYQSGEYSDTTIQEIVGDDFGTTGQLKGINVTVNNTQSKGFVSQEQLYAGGGSFTGKSGHWIYNGGFSDQTHEPAGESSWENTGIEFNMGASGEDCPRCLYDPVDHSGRQIFVAAIGANSTDSWAANTSYTAKYDFYGLFCQQPGPGKCMMYNPDHSSHISGSVTTNVTINLTGETVANGSNTVETKEVPAINPDYDTITISGDGIPSQAVSSWTYSGTGMVLKFGTATTAASSNASITLQITRKIPYIFRAVAPNGDDLTTSKADYVATSTGTEPDWSKHLDGTPFAEQVDSSGKPVSGSVWWKKASEDSFGVGVAFNLTGHSRQYYDVGWGSGATYDDAVIDISGSRFRNSDGKAAQIRLNSRVPAIDFTGALDSDESITGSGLSGKGPEQYKNNHTLGYDGVVGGLSYKVQNKDVFHITDTGTTVVDAMTVNDKNGDAVYQIQSDGSLIITPQLATASGTSITDALVVSGGVVDVNAGADGSGVKLPASMSWTGHVMTIKNNSGNKINVYPMDTGWNFSAHSAGAAITLPADSSILLYRADGGKNEIVTEYHSPAP